MLKTMSNVKNHNGTKEAVTAIGGRITNTNVQPCFGIISLQSHYPEILECEIRGLSRFDRES